VTDQAAAPGGSRRGTLLALALVGIGLAVLAGGIALLVTSSGGSSSNTASIATRFFGTIQRTVDADDLEKMKAAGVGSVRFQLSWAASEPSRGTFRWTATDPLVAGLASAGIEPVPFVFASPPWIAAKPTDPPVGGSDAEQAWRDFLSAAVKRYGPGGDFWNGAYQTLCKCDAPPVAIRAWQIWNEPNLSHYFSPAPSVSRYATLVAISHDAITAQDPNAEIVLAGMPGFGDPDAWTFLDELYQQGIRNDFDAVALHPYARDLDQFQHEIEEIRAVLTRNGAGDTPLWLTEVGWGSAPPDRFGLNKGIDGQAEMLTQSFKLVVAHRAQWHVGRLFWFYWRDPPPGGNVGECSFCRSAGLLTYNGESKPAYSAYQSFANPD